MSNENKGLLLGLVAIIAFGLTLPITRAVITYFDPLFIGLGRACLAGVIAMLLLYVNRQTLPTIAQLKQLCVISLGVAIGFPVLSSWAMQYVPASHGGVVIGILPLATVLASVFIHRERPSIGFWLVSILGSSLVVVYALLQNNGGFHIADLALFGAVISAAIGYSLGARLTKTLGGWQVICWALVIALPFTLFPTFYYAPVSFSEIPLTAYLYFLYLALISQLFGFFAWYKGLALGGVARVSQVQLIQPFVTLLASVLLLGEQISLLTGLFIVLVIALVYLGKKMPIKQA